jgi:hypothetical protein
MLRVWLVSGTAHAGEYGPIQYDHNGSLMNLFVATPKGGYVNMIYAVPRQDH